jgi:hypothetical protein
MIFLIVLFVITSLFNSSRKRAKPFSWLSGDNKARTGPDQGLAQVEQLSLQKNAGTKD